MAGPSGQTGRLGIAQGQGGVCMSCCSRKWRHLCLQTVSLRSKAAQPSICFCATCPVSRWIWTWSFLIIACRGTWLWHKFNKPWVKRLSACVHEGFKPTACRRSCGTCRSCATPIPASLSSRQSCSLTDWALSSECPTALSPRLELRAALAQAGPGRGNRQSRCGQSPGLGPRRSGRSHRRLRPSSVAHRPPQRARCRRG